MAINYLYLEDQVNDIANAYVGRVERAARSIGFDLSIELMHPRDFNLRFEILSDIDSSGNVVNPHYDGCIFDLRLDQKVNENDEKVNYRATSLAQEIRTRATEGERDLPLVLWSVDDKLRQSYNRDNTGHDLFEMKCVKEEIVDKNTAPVIAARLVSLSIGYKEISSFKSNGTSSEIMVECLGLNKSETQIDSRILEYFDQMDEVPPIHEYSRFIIGKVLSVTGPLIDDAVLAARLGLDLDNSDDFGALKEKLRPRLAYQGVFCEGWPRWWAFSLERWWSHLDNVSTPLRITPAEERVEILKNHLHFDNLVAAKPLIEGYSTAFWVVCQSTGRPLAPRDGLALSAPQMLLWQDRQYISISEALKSREIQKQWIIDPLDMERLNRIKSVM